MAIIFHEGLPGAGKSYEAMKTILQQLEKGRAVFAYMEGLNNEKIAAYLQKPIEYVTSLVHSVDRENVKEIFSIVENDSFVVIDEVQNFWPATREKLPDDMTRFVTEHRHRGLDILIMGQDYRDCHNLWKRRIDKKLSFVKLDAIGAASRYRWTAEQLVGTKWNKIAAKTEKYDASFFGLYSSHEAETDNKETYNDERLSVWKSPVFKYVIPAVIIGLVFAINHLVSFFSPVEANTLKPEPVKHLTHAIPDKVATDNIRPGRISDESTIKVLDFVGDLLDSYRPRMSGVIESGDRMMGYVEFLDGSFHVKERLTIDGLKSLGWTVVRKDYGLILSKGDASHIVTAWPVDPFGSISSQTRASPALKASPREASTAPAPIS